MTKSKPHSIMGSVEIKYWTIMRNLSHQNVYSIAKALIEKPMSLNELAKTTRIDSATVNRHLYDMKRYNLVIHNYNEKRYYSSAYCKIFIEFIDKLDNLNNSNGEK